MAMDWLNNILWRTRKPVIVVSGLPRSGTSMMMSMLAAGGIEPVVDGIREADENNPKGYYEFERVKKLKEGDFAWVEGAQGKAVKVISALLEHLPRDYPYKVVFMRRAMPEILASQRAMLVRNGKATDTVSDEALSVMYTRHLAQVEGWLAKQPNMQVLYVHYNEVLKDPAPHLARVNEFFGRTLDLAAMRTVVDQNLYRERKAKPGTGI